MKRALLTLIAVASTLFVTNLVFAQPVTPTNAAGNVPVSGTTGTFSGSLLVSGLINQTGYDSNSYYCGDYPTCSHIFGYRNSSSVWILSGAGLNYGNSGPCTLDTSGITCGSGSARASLINTQDFDTAGHTGVLLSGNEPDSVATNPAVRICDSAAAPAANAVLAEVAYNCTSTSQGTQAWRVDVEGDEVNSGSYSTAGTVSPQYQCTGAASCDFQGASNQNVNLKTQGSGTVTINGTAIDMTFCVYNTGNLAAAVALGETSATHSITVNNLSKITQDVAGVGAGNFVVKLCTDGTTCAAGNTYLTYTEACTAAAGTRTAATVQNSGAVPAASVLTLSVTTACATTDPAANICVHYTLP